jgi:outer membrane protein assembly factor BamA
MISRWRAALIFSVLSILHLGADAAGEDVVRRVIYPEESVVPVQELSRGSLIVSGTAFSDSLLRKELVRIDSLYFSYGFLGASVAVDTFHSNGDIDVRFVISEGEQARIGSVSIVGPARFESARVERLLGVSRGGFFDPASLQASISRLLSAYNDNGFPYAQVWLTEFDFHEENNTVDLSFSIVEGGESTISRVIFEGLSKTDTSFAMRTSRLRPGSPYRESDVLLAGRYLRSTDLFESVEEARVERFTGGSVDVVIPVKERVRSNRFQGALGFSRRNGGDYVLNGSAELELRNIAGGGRDAHFQWLNDGDKYSTIDLRFTERFLFSLPVHLDGEVGQVIEDTLYTLHSAGMYVRFPIGPEYSLLAGAAVDRNLPGVGELLRSIRQRYRVGFRKAKGEYLFVDAHVDGALKKKYLSGDREENEAQFLYRLESSIDAPVSRSQSIFVRFVSEAVFSSKDIPAAETFSLGGARSLRGSRENQFRGERIAYMNIEYRIGAVGWLFVFDDVGAFYRASDGWTFKNGIGFGLRSASPVGIVVLSFGVGDRLSLEGTRIHISLVENF